MSPSGAVGGKNVFLQGSIFFKFLFLLEIFPELMACKDSQLHECREDQFCRIVEEIYLQITNYFCCYSYRLSQWFTNASYFGFSLSSVPVDRHGQLFF